MKRAALFVMPLVLALSCSTAPPESAGADGPEGMYFRGTYVGALPCADCEGIATELAVWSKGEFDYTECRFRMTETYLGKPEGANVFVAEGAWYLERGSGDDPDDTVYALDLGNGEWRNYVIEDESTLTLLSQSENKRIVSDLNYSLVRR